MRIREKKVIVKDMKDVMILNLVIHLEEGSRDRQDRLYATQSHRAGEFEEINGMNRTYGKYDMSAYKIKRNIQWNNIHMLGNFATILFATDPCELAHFIMVRGKEFVPSQLRSNIGNALLASPPAID
jgi:hypothetical protein